MKFKPGDRVQIKTWEEMEKEYGLDKDGVITPHDAEISFVSTMRFLCGAFATVECVNKYGTIKLKDFIPDNKSKWKLDFSFAEFMLKPAKTEKYELHIMSDGKKTTAVYKKNGEIVSRSEANLHPDDEFNFKTGAQIAFDRVFQPEPEKKGRRALYINGTIFCGNVGDPADLRDLCDRPLFIGDVVLLKDNAGERKIFITNGTQTSIENPMIRNDFGEYSLLLVTPFHEVKPNTSVGGITMLVK